MHQDFFYITLSQADGSPIAVTQQIPPLTTYFLFINRRPNPSYRVYMVDRDTYELLDYTQYRLYLKEANEKKVANWRSAYTFLDYYNVNDMRPQTYKKIITKMENNDTEFYRIYTMMDNERGGLKPTKSKFIL